MDNNINDTVRITIDLPTDVAVFFTTDAKENDRIRKNQIEFVLKQYAEKKMPKTEGANA